MEPLADLHMPQAKRCIKCSELKDRDRFAQSPVTSDRKQGACKDCMKIYRLEHKAQIAARMKIYDEDRFAKGLREHQINPDYVRERNKAYRDAHKEEMRAYRLKNKDKRREQLAEWEAEHPGNNRERSSRRRAAIANAEINDYSDPQWQETQEVQKHCCYYCGKRCKGKLTQDHIQPLSKGGNHTFRNVIGVCGECNARKKDGEPPIAVQIPLLILAPPAKPRRPRKQAKTAPQQTLALQAKD